MIQYSAALGIIGKEFRKIKFKTEKVHILSSLNRVLAEDVLSDTPQPVFTNSAMDGYAVKYGKGISKWKVTGEISAGKFKNFKLSNNEAVLIMTGSMMPGSTDTVIPAENVTRSGNDIKLKNNISITKGQSVRRQGEDIKYGKKVIHKHTFIHSNNIQLAASCGKEYVRVYRKLKAGILTTGNELTDINIKPSRDKIRASNLYSLLAAANECGIEPVKLGILKDDKLLLGRKIKRALSTGIDLLITSGGVSEGKYDYLPEIFNELGVKILFHKVNIKPGKPMLFGVYRKNDKNILVFGLPGNPVSCYVNFILFIRNVYFSMFNNLKPYRIKAVLTQELMKNDNKLHFIRGILTEKNGLNYASAPGAQSSANALGLSTANVIIEFPESDKILKTRSIVECIKI